MGWRGVNIVVDVVTDEDNVTPPKTLLHPDALFNYDELAYWKVFLLGFSKYSSKECWNPEKPLKGLPEYRNDWLYNLVESNKKEGVASEEEMDKVFTYYTLKELKEIDLDEPVGLPENPESWDDYSRCLDLKMNVEGEWVQYGLNRLSNFGVETLKRAVESDNPIKIRIEEENFGSREESLVNKTGGKTKLKAKPRKKRYYGKRFPKLVSLLSEIYENNSFELKHSNYQDISEDDIRLIIGQHF